MQSQAVAAVLAGGRNRRMGADKADLTLDGETFLDRIVGTLSGSFDTVIVCGGDRAPDGTTLVADPALGHGPLAGVVGAFAAAAGRDVFMTAVDMPMLTGDVIDALAKPLLSADQARIARVDGRPQPLCGLYGKALGPYAMARLDAADRSMMAFIRRAPHLTLVDVDELTLRNINTQADYEALIADTR
ncbi:MAG: molybdenum cofactor guanylyltransferase [Acidimicrobiia bacterium]